MFDKLLSICNGLTAKYPNGNNPFQIITRLTEECGELASQVNHFENTGIKYTKHGEPDKMKLAKEIQDVMRAALQLSIYYDVQQKLEESITSSYNKLQS